MFNKQATADYTDAQLEQAVERSGWFARAGLEPDWPLSFSEVVELLHDGAEYAVDADRLSDLVNRGILETGEAGEWSARHVTDAAGFLELLRLWNPTPSIHDPKKHPTQLTLEREGAENLAMKPDAPLRYLLILMTQADHREMREKILTAIAVALEHDHGIEL